MGTPPRSDDTLVTWVHAPTGCSRLCYTLAGIGLAVSSAAGFATYRLLHEPLEAVGASVVDHMASAKCTAIAKSLTALSIARQDVINGEPEGERSKPDPNAAIGVVTPGAWSLEDFHSANLSATTALAVLRRLPLEEPTGGEGEAVNHALHHASAHLRTDLDHHGCSQLGYGLNPSVVRVYAIPSLPPGWLAFLQGPWQHNGRSKVSFALVDLKASTLEMSGHHHALHDLFPGGLGNKLGIRVAVSPPSVLRDELSLHHAMPDLDAEDHKLLGLKIVPFANQVVSTHLKVDHGALDRISRRSALMVFLMGLLATSSVVLVSRNAELRMHRLNQALLRESRTDGLTRIANRRAWDETLVLEESRRQRYGNRYGLVVVDLDGFKQINDQQGHQAGDEVLQITASKLASQLRTTDLLARVGGDEFALLLYNPDQTGLAELVARLKLSLREAGVNASIGYALSEERATLDQTWAQADDAMYAVKTGSQPQGVEGRSAPSSAAHPESPPRESP